MHKVEMERLSGNDVHHSGK